MPSETVLRVTMFILVYACAAAPFFLSGVGLVKIKDGFKQDDNKKIKGGAALLMLTVSLFYFYITYRARFG